MNESVKRRQSPLKVKASPGANRSPDELTEAEYDLFVAALKKLYDSLDTPEHHLAYVRERLAAARAES